MNIKDVRLENNQKIYESFEIKRKPFYGSKTGDLYYGYSIKSMLKNHNVTVNVKCKDNVGYKTLDIVFDGANKVYLMTVKSKIEKNVFTTYYAVSLDDDGTLTRANIVPAAQSDQDILFNLLEKADMVDRLARKSAALDLEGETEVSDGGVKHIDNGIDEELIEGAEE